MFALYVGSTLILPLEMPVLLKFLAIIGFTGLLCFLLFEIIRRIGILRPLFGLKWTFRTKVKQKSLEGTVLQGDDHK
jgi:hypothetical protein